MNLVPDFTATTIVNEIVTTATTNIFINYNSGTFDDLYDPANTEIFAEVVDSNNVGSNCVTMNTSIVDSPFAVDKLTACGCILAGSDDALKIDFICSQNVTTQPLAIVTCEDFAPFMSAGVDGLLHFDLSGYGSQYSNITSLALFSQLTGLNGEECCLRQGGTLVAGRDKIVVCQLRPPVGPCDGITHTYNFDGGFYIFNFEGNDTYDMNKIPVECCTSINGHLSTIQDPANPKSTVTVCVKNTDIGIGVPTSNQS